MKRNRTIDKIISKVSGSRGAPMGRSNIGTRPTDQKIYDCRVPMVDGAYDRGGAYWGMGRELRVSYTKDLSYVEFYRKGLLPVEGGVPIPDDDNLLSMLQYKSIQIFITYIGSDHVKYDAYLKGDLIFSGKDYRPSPMYAQDSLDAMTSLISFLTLQKGDTGSEYFKNYGEKQWAWTEHKDVEDLRRWVSDVDGDESPYQMQAKVALNKLFTNDFS